MKPKYFEVGIFIGTLSVIYSSLKKCRLMRNIRKAKFFNNRNPMEIILCRHIKKIYINRLLVDTFNFGNYKPIQIIKPIRIISNLDEARKKLNY